MEDFKNIRKQKAFQTPDHYFEKFEAEIMQQVSQREAPSTYSWIDQLVENLQLRFVIPTSLVAILVAVVIYLGFENKQEIVFQDDYITSYLLENTDSEFELAIYQMAYAEESKDIILEDSEILEYLYENQIEEELINEILY